MIYYIQPISEVIDYIQPISEMLHYIQPISEKIDYIQANQCVYIASDENGRLLQW